MISDKNIKVLMIDDDIVLTQTISDFFHVEGGFEVTIRNDGQSAYKTVTSSSYDIIILDVNMPVINGFEALKLIRNHCDIPVIMLTARGDDLDKILGLEIGADDYVPKPCHLRELVARVRAIMRRVQNKDTYDSENKTLLVGDLKVEFGTQSVSKDGQFVNLTAAEFMVLETMIIKLGEIVRKGEMALHALGRNIMPFDRSVDVHIVNLRKKLGPLPNGQQRIKTVRGRGYFLVSE
ncbi:response regulator [Marinicella sp. W31]|uniref:response regulator n=1 Tax=Marinicella sp. W31 TaxID=3023713 RepID=UPI0037576A28